MPKTAPVFKKNAVVKFKTRHSRTGKGKIVAINETIKGPWYVIREDSGLETACRAVQLTLVA